MSSQRKDYFILHFIVLIWGFTAILGKLITIPSLEMVFYRTLIAFLALFIMMRMRKVSVSIDLRSFAELLGVGLIIALHWIFFFWACKIASASIALIGMATITLWTSFTEPFFTGRKVRLLEVLLGLAVIGGLYIIFASETGSGVAIVIATVSAFLASLFSVINAKLIRKHGHYTITVYEMLGAFLGTVLLMPFYIQFVSETGALQLTPMPMDWVYLLILALVCTVYPFSASVELMKRISPFMINLSINLEPLYGILLAFLIFGENEQLNTGFYIGGGIILISIVLYPLLNRYFSKKALEPDILR